MGLKNSLIYEAILGSIFPQDLGLSKKWPENGQYGTRKKPVAAFFWNFIVTLQYRHFYKMCYNILRQYHTRKNQRFYNSEVIMFIHEVARPVGDSTVSQVVIYEFAHEPVDFWQCISDAITDYCLTPAGRQRFADGQMLTYNDFLDYVPNELCQKHGFSRVMASAEAKHIDGQDALVHRCGLTSYIRRQEQEQERQTKIKKALPRVTAEMTRVKESIPRMSDWSFTRMTTTAVRLAEEYVDNDLYGLREFVEQRLEQLAKPRPAQTSEAQA